MGLFFKNVVGLLFGVLRFIVGGALWIFVLALVAVMTGTNLENYPETTVGLGILVSYLVVFISYESIRKTKKEKNKR